MTYVTCFTLEILYSTGERTVMLMKLLALHLFVNVRIITNSCQFAVRDHSFISSFCVVFDTLIKFKAVLEICVSFLSPFM
jgi:hypothetical protein